MLTKTKLKDTKKYWVRLKQSTTINGKVRSPAAQLKLTGALAKEHYEALLSITPALLS